MVKYFYLAAALVASVHAIPLNINLGAYSPALVVGDGEISFGGRQDVSSLMNVLEGAAVNAAAGAVQQQPARQPAAQPGQPAGVVAAPANPGTVAAQNQDQAQQIASLQGMGKEIAPRVVPINAPKLNRRDLSGFDRALQYAENALTKGPKVQLGTGAEGSGVGIIVDNNQQAAARPGTGNGEAAAPAPGAGRAEGAIVAQQRVKGRDVEQPRRRAKVTTMYVRSGVPAGLQASSEELVARDVAAPAAAPAGSVTKRDGAIDAVNLNVSGEGVTMTFVETADDDEE